MNNYYSLQSILASNPFIDGMGNTLRGDDAIGVEIIERLSSDLDGFYDAFLNVEDIIEGHVFSLAARPESNIIIIDAVEYPAPKGTILFTAYDDSTEDNAAASTHKLSLELSVKILKAHNKNVYLLGIVTDNIDFGTKMSTEVRQSAYELIETITQILSDNRKEICYA